MSAVRFVKPWSLYNPGETAGFDDATTAFLIETGTAVLADPARPAPKRAKKTPATDAAEPAGEGAAAETPPAD